MGARMGRTSVPYTEPEITQVANARELLARCDQPSSSARAPMIHRIKVWPTPFRDVLTGRKRFDVRLDDRDYQTGDAVELLEFDPKRCVCGQGQSPTHALLSHASGEVTGRSTLMLIGYVQRGAPMPAGWCAFDLISAEDINRLKLAMLVRS